MKRNRAESKVRKQLRENGWTLSKQRTETQSGVDVVAMKKGQVLLIEVKKANLHNRSWQVDKVSTKQAVVCDTIAIVLPRGVIVFQPMSEHLRLCAKNGMRYVTDVVNLFKNATT